MKSLKSFALHAYITRCKIASEQLIPALVDNGWYACSDVIMALKDLGSPVTGGIWCDDEYGYASTDISQLIRKEYILSSLNEISRTPFI